MNSAGRYRETVENWSKAYLDTVEQARLESRNLVLVGDREGLWKESNFPSGTPNLSWPEQLNRAYVVTRSNTNSKH